MSHSSYTVNRIESEAIRQLEYSHQIYTYRLEAEGAKTYYLNYVT